MYVVAGTGVSKPWLHAFRWKAQVIFACWLSGEQDNVCLPWEFLQKIEPRFWQTQMPRKCSRERVLLCQGPTCSLILLLKQGQFCENFVAKSGRDQFRLMTRLLFPSFGSPVLKNHERAHLIPQLMELRKSERTRSAPRFLSSLGMDMFNLMLRKAIYGF